jgi:hypothetical protein
MAFIELTKSGKCDVTFTHFNEHNSILAQTTITFDVRPTLKELKEYFKVTGSKLLRLTTTPSCKVKYIKLK